MTAGYYGEEYELEWQELNRRLIEAVFRLQRGRSPEEDAVLALAAEWVRLSGEREERATALLRIEAAHWEDEKAWDEAEARALEKA